MGAQAQLLSMHAYRNCETLPREARAALRGNIKPIGELRRRVTFAAKMTSWLCGVAATTVQNTVVHVDARGPSKRPCLKRKFAPAPTTVGQERAGVAGAAAGAAAAEEGDDAGSSDGAERGASADVADDQRDGELADGSRSTQLPGLGNLIRINALVT